MKIKEQTIKELEELRPAELFRVYELILSLKKTKEKQFKEPTLAYMRGREALRQCKGSLSEDILAARENRI